MLHSEMNHLWAHITFDAWLVMIAILHKDEFLGKFAWWSLTITMALTGVVSLLSYGAK
jgi:hypothetical protein